MSRLSEDRLDLIGRYMGRGDPATQGHAAREPVEDASADLFASAPGQFVEHARSTRITHKTRPSRSRLRVTLLKARLPLAILALSLLVAVLAARA